MNAETIAAAIKKLQRLRDENYTEPEDFTNHLRSGETAALLVALHRTIDAQLAILRHTLDFYRGDLGIGANRHVVELAKAILGSTP